MAYGARKKAQLEPPRWQRIVAIVASSILQVYELLHCLRANQRRLYDCRLSPWRAGVNCASAGLFPPLATDTRSPCVQQCICPAEVFLNGLDETDFPFQRSGRASKLNPEDRRLSTVEEALCMQQPQEACSDHSCSTHHRVRASGAEGDGAAGTAFCCDGREAPGMPHSRTPGYEVGFEVGWTAVNRGLGLRCKSKLPRVGRDESSLMIARTSARNTPRGCTLFHFEYLDPMHLAATGKRTIYYTPAVGQRRIDSPRRNCAATAQRGTIRARG
ncbi:hypothetical protein V8E51_016948 [Hyaloscypha variabilis]